MSAAAPTRAGLPRASLTVWRRRGLLQASAAAFAAGALWPRAAGRAARLEDDLPYGGRFYGQAVHAVSPGNTKLRKDEPVAVRFRAERSGRIEALRWEIRRNSRPKHKNRYSIGDGGRVAVELRRAGGDGAPDTTEAGLLAATRPNNGSDEPFCIPDDTWRSGFRPNREASPGHQTWDFVAPAEVASGRLYFLVFHQLEERRAVSVNALHNGTAQTGPDWNGPYFGDDFMMYRSKGGEYRRNLIDSNGILALDLYYEDGAVTGTPLTFMGLPEMPIGGARQVQQAFTVTDYSRRVDGAWIGAYRRDDTPSPLRVLLEREDGTLLEKVELAREALPVFERDVLPHRWTRLRFTEPHELAQGQAYRLRLEAEEGGYLARAGINAADRGKFKNRNIVWTRRNALVTATEDGAEWAAVSIEAWDEGERDRRDMSLALLFTVAG
jgi:hypothetical protein